MTVSKFCWSYFCQASYFVTKHPVICFMLFLEWQKWIPSVSYTQSFVHKEVRHFILNFTKLLSCKITFSFCKSLQSLQISLWLQNVNHKPFSSFNIFGTSCEQKPWLKVGPQISILRHVLLNTQMPLIFIKVSWYHFLHVCQMPNNAFLLLCDTRSRNLCMDK